MRVWWRWTIGRRLWPVFAAVTVAHSLLRPAAWVDEWAWAAHRYAFVNTLLGPLACGAACVDGDRLQRGRSSIAGSPRVGWVPVGAGIALWGRAMVAHIIGVGVVTALVIANGARGWPRPSSLLEVLAAFVLTGAYIAVGQLVGASVASRIAAPFVVLGSFAVTLLLFDLAPLAVDLGSGAGTSLIGLQPGVARLVAQLLLWTTAAVIAVIETGRSLRGSRPSPPVFAVASLLCVATTIAVQAAGPQLADAPTHPVCLGDVCLDESYADRLVGAAERVAAVEAPFRAVGVSVDLRVDQAASSWGSGVIPVSPGVLRSSAPLVDEALLALEPAPFGCELTERVVGAQLDLASWLRSTLGAAGARTAFTDPGFAGSQSAVAAAVATAVDVVQRCTPYRP